MGLRREDGWRCSCVGESVRESCMYRASSVATACEACVDNVWRKSLSRMSSVVHVKAPGHKRRHRWTGLGSCDLSIHPRIQHAQGTALDHTPYNPPLSSLSCT